MKYFNLITKEIKEMTDMEFELANYNEQWIKYDIVLNKIVVTSINDYRVFPKDELGINKAKILPLLQYFKPVNKESGLKIARYYKVCPYCLSKLDNKNGVIILDCRENFCNIKKMQLDVYNEVSCCNNTYIIPFSKTQSTKARADYIRNKLEQKELVILNYSIKSLNIEVIVKPINILKMDLNDDYEIMKKIFNDKLYLGIKNNDILEHEEVVTDALEKRILCYLKYRR